MRITEITYRENKLGSPGSNFKSRVLEAKATISKGEKPSEVAERLKDWVQEQLGIKPEITSEERQVLNCLSGEVNCSRLYTGTPSDTFKSLNARGLIEITFLGGKPYQPSGTYQVAITDKGKGAL